MTLRVLWLAVVSVMAASDGGFDAGVVDAGVQFPPPPPLVKQPLSRKVDEARVERVFASLDARARAAQLLLAYPQISRGAVEVGGVVFVGNSLRNIGKATEKISSLRSRAKIPLFFAVDMEGGPSNRMKSVRALKEMPDVESPAAQPDEQTEQRRNRALPDKVLARLDEELRAVFVLQDIEGLSKREAADALGVPQGTVASRLRRARVAFDALLREDLEASR